MASQAPPQDAPPQDSSQNPPQGPPQGQPRLPPGMQQPTPEQIQAMQRQIAADAQKAGMTVPQYVEMMKKRAMEQHQAQQAQQQAQAQRPQQQPIQPGPPTPAALAVANFLRSQELKTRTSLLDEKRRDMFRVKRAIRALQSPAYEKARAKNSVLPEVKDRASAENTFKLLPMSLMALRVTKIDPNAGHDGHGHGRKKRVKGLWNVRIVQQQNTDDDDYYIWLYEGSQWKMKVYAVLALILVFAVVLFPLWPLFLRQGVWYLSMGMLGLIGLFFAMAIFRLILFCATVFTVPPGLWLYPNLFEDVGFFDSFRPVWAWQETAEDKKAKKEAKKLKKLKKAEAAANGKPSKSKTAETPAVPIANAPAAATAAATATGASPNPNPQAVQQRGPMQASVEEADDE